MKRFQLFLTFLQLPTDFVMVVAAFLLAYWFRLQPWLSPPAGYVLPLREYLELVGLMAIAWLVIFAFSGMYSLGSTYTPLQIWQRTFMGVSISLAIFIIVLFGLKEAFFSRLIAAYGWGFALALVWLGRLLLLALQRGLTKSGVIDHRVVVIGEHATGQMIAKFYESRLAKVQILPEAAIDSSRLAELIDIDKIDEVIVAVNLTSATSLALIGFCERSGIRFRYLPTLTELYSAHAISDTVAGHPLIELRPTRLDGWGRIIKRGFDFLLAAIGLIVLAPLMWYLATRVRLDSIGPALFIQPRAGQLGKPFNFYKFRSMHAHLSTGEGYGGAAAEQLLDQLKITSNEGAGILFKIKNDPRITKFGRFIRRTSLDELPQLFNVLNGEMSLVGPRPPLISEVDQYNEAQFRRLLVKPGITGLWQVSGRSDASFDEYMKLDMYYIEHWSFWLDVQLIFKTIVVALTGKGAY